MKLPPSALNALADAKYYALALRAVRAERLREYRERLEAERVRAEVLAEPALLWSDET